MNDEIRAPQPTQSRSGPREGMTRDAGRGGEVTTTVLAKDGKLGVAIPGSQFAPITTPVEARAGDVVRVRIEQSGKETTVRVLRVISSPQSGSSAALTSSQRTLRDLFPAETIRPLHDLLASLRELLDESGVPSGVIGGGNSTLSTDAAGLLTGLNPAAAPRPARIPAAYGARSDELRGSAAGSPKGQSAAPTPSATSSTPGSIGITPPTATTLPTQLLTLIEQALARAMVPTSSLSALLQPPLPGEGADTTPQLFQGNSSDNRTLKGEQNSTAETKLTAPSLTSVFDPRTVQQQRSTLTEPLPISVPAALSSSIQNTATSQTASERFLRAAAEAQPILEQYSKIFDALNQPSYAVTALTIGGHVMPLQLSMTREQPHIEQPDEESAGSAPKPRGYTRVRMNIAFPTLGALGIDLAYRDTEVLLKFIVENREIGKFLEAELPRLGEELTDAGFTAVNWFTEQGGVPEVVPGWFREMVEGGVVV